MSSYKKRRQEIIKNWLDGKEDDEYDVIPTKIDGKYILRPKNKPSYDGSAINIARNSEQNVPENIPEEQNVHEENIQENNPQEQNIQEKIPEENISEKIPKQNYKADILKQLELMNESFNKFNEERRIKQEKKQKKKEMKRMIYKEFAKNKVMVEGSSDEETNEPQVVYLEKPAPIRIRRRLNLLNGPNSR